jgi:hypothetical protein
MATPFARDLVFHVNRGDIGADHMADGARDVERAAPTGVDIHQEWQAAGFGDALGIGDHIVEGADAKVGHAE